MKLLLPKSDRGVTTAVIAAAVCIAVVVRSRFTVDGMSHFTLVDDAMISLRYARNLTSGNGLVWNVGEPPIEGFSNLGYTLMMSPGFIFGDNALSLYLPVVITIAAFAATVWLTVALTEEIWPEAAVTSLAAGGMVALDFGLVFWTARGMEVPLVTASVIGMTLLLVKWRHTETDWQLWAGAALGAVAVVIRFDAILPVMVVGFWLVITEFVAHRAERKAWVVPAVALGTAVLVMAFQAIYFGDPLPNTYWLKVSGAPASERIAVGWHVLLENSGPQLRVLLILGPVLLAVFSIRTLFNPAVLLLAAIAISSISYSIWVGGDYAEPQVHTLNRFILVGLPPMCALAAGGAGAAAKWLSNNGLRLIGSTAGSGADRLRSVLQSNYVGAIAGALAVGAVLLPNYAHLDALVSGRDIPLLNEDQRRTALGLHLRATLPADALIATHLAGQIPYYSQLRTVDLLGKSDRTIAKLPQTADRFRPGHNKWDYAYGIKGLAPDVVADQWGSVNSYLKEHGGYELLPNGLWVSTNPRVPIDTKALGECYWQCKAPGPDGK